MSQPKKAPTNSTTIAFMVLLCFSCALALSVLASALKERQSNAAALDRAKQMLMAAKIFSPDGYFLLEDENGAYSPAKHVGDGRLAATDSAEAADPDAIFAVYEKRITAFLVDEQGQRTTFEAAGIDEEEYLADFRKTGYDNQPLKLVYEIVANPEEGQDSPGVDGYLFHVTGFGLWDAIYGYLAIKPDGDTVIGISWYEHKETPGLGAGIATPEWQRQFPGKQIFEENPEGATDYARAPLGITVVRGMVVDVYPSGPKADSAVDGMAGATLTGNGVTKAYKDTLANYRPFLLSLKEDEGTAPATNSTPVEG